MSKNGSGTLIYMRSGTGLYEIDPIARTTRLAISDPALSDMYYIAYDPFTGGHIGGRNRAGGGQEYFRLDVAGSASGIASGWWTPAAGSPRRFGWRPSPRISPTRSCSPT